MAVAPRTWETQCYTFSPRRGNGEEKNEGKVFVYMPQAALRLDPVIKLPPNAFRPAAQHVQRLPTRPNSKD